MAIEQSEIITIINLFGFLQIVFLGFATYWSYKIYRYDRLNKTWLLFPIATFIFALRRFFILVKFNYFEELIGKYLWFDRVLVPFLIAVLLTLAVYEMMKKFESFTIIEKKTKEKATAITKQKKKRI